MPDTKTDKQTKIEAWNYHVGGCLFCSRVDTDNTSTLSNACCEGGPLLREYLVVVVPPKKKQRAPKDEFQTTKAKAKGLTRYK
jgi:hypothetical protein